MTCAYVKIISMKEFLRGFASKTVDNFNIINAAAAAAAAAACLFFHSSASFDCNGR